MMRLRLPTTEFDICASRYAGKERDVESGNDDFGARYYASAMGRWLSPDWAQQPTAIPFANLSNPQSLNLYSFVLNNPLRMVDADGHDGCSMSGMDVDCNSLTSDVDAHNKSEEEADALIAQSQLIEQAQQQNTETGDAPEQTGNAGTGQQTPAATDNPSLMFAQGSGQKGERGQTSKPDVPAKGARPVFGKDGKQTGWSLPSQDGKRTPKTLEWGRANGLSEREKALAEKSIITTVVGIIGVTAARWVLGAAAAGAAAEAASGP